MDFNNNKAAVFRRMQQCSFALTRNNTTENLHFRVKRKPMSFTNLGIHKNIKSEIMQLGSSMPKSTMSMFYSQKYIKPPAEIAAEPIIKAAIQIDKQTASIPWERIDVTLQVSKQNIKRAKEIHMPIKETKTNFIIKPTKTKLEEFLSSHRNSIHEEVRNIFAGQNFDTQSFAMQTDEMIVTDGAQTLVELINKTRPISPIKSESDDFIKSMHVKKYENKPIKNTPVKPLGSDKKIPFIQNCTENSLGLLADNGNNSSKIKVKIRMKDRAHTQNIATPCNMCNTLPGPQLLAPYGVSLKGNKMKSKYGTMFIPVSNKSLTPNHFLNITFT
ncbi:hypothetical protein SteCoe_4758 [Stentor coeruleus]|uniref:Uncharacterized protein n=1 Tax=Stentor coeruleus TaxID=5963 RepID=A0A1R2CU59_9CILI|nr:hypothetical protein SteCoe_4758 [Stentor coeruleus]